MCNKNDAAEYLGAAWLLVTGSLANLDGKDRVGRIHIVEALSCHQKLAAFRQAA